MLPVRLRYGLDLRAAFGHFASTRRFISFRDFACAESGRDLSNQGGEIQSANGTGRQHLNTTQSQQIH
jgi:hypothetical protein